MKMGKDKIPEVRLNRPRFRDALIPEAEVAALPAKEIAPAEGVSEQEGSRTAIESAAADTRASSSVDHEREPEILDAADIVSIGVGTPTAVRPTPGAKSIRTRTRDTSTGPERAEAPKAGGAQKGTRISFISDEDIRLALEDERHALRIAKPGQKISLSTVICDVLGKWARERARLKQSELAKLRSAAKS
jgi:hypothetical protein